MDRISQAVFCVLLCLGLAFAVTDSAELGIVLAELPLAGDYIDGGRQSRHQPVKAVACGNEVIIRTDPDNIAPRARRCVNGVGGDGFHHAFDCAVLF